MGDRTITEASRSLEDCASAKEVKAAVERLLECGMLEPVPAAPPPPPTPPRRFGEGSRRGASPAPPHPTAPLLVGIPAGDLPRPRGPRGQIGRVARGAEIG